MSSKTFHRPDEEVLRQILKNHPFSPEGASIRLAWLHGLTREEIAALTWGNISFEENLVVLKEREIPLEEETKGCLRSRYIHYGDLSPFVIISDRLHKPMAKESISRLVRLALDAGGLSGVQLKDLRQDYVIRQLQSHDWPYVARVSGVSIHTLFCGFSDYFSGPKQRTKVTEIDDFRLWGIMRKEGHSSAGLALWMTRQMGMRTTELVSLTWDQVDFTRNALHLERGDVPLSNTVRRLLLDVREERGKDCDPHVILSPKSQTPMDQPRLSKLVRSVLIQGGLENVALSDLRREDQREREDQQVLDRALECGSILRADVMKLLHISKTAAYLHLRALTEAGKLVRVGAKYYLPDRVVPPENQLAIVQEYLEKEGPAFRQELAAILHIESRQCARILKHWVAEGELIQIGQQYCMPGEELAAK